MTEENKQQYVGLGVKVPAPLRNEIDKAANEVWKTRSEWVRDVLVQGLANQDDYKSNKE